MPHANLVARLQQSFHEESVAHGISADGTLLEIFASPEGSFTAVKVMPVGTACIVDFGAAWQTLQHGVDGPMTETPPLERAIRDRLNLPLH